MNSSVMVKVNNDFRILRSEVIFRRFRVRLFLLMKSSLLRPTNFPGSNAII